MTSSSSTKGILALIGGILALVAVSMVWFRFKLSIQGYILPLNLTLNGLGLIEDTNHIFNHTEATLQNSGYLIMFGGIIALIFGVLMVANVLKSNNKKIGCILIIGAGILCIMGLISWFYNASHIEIDAGGLENLFAMENLTLDTGFWLVIIGSPMILIDGILGIKK